MFWRSKLLVVTILLLTIVGRSYADEKNRFGQPKAGEEREFKIAKDVKMKFCWVPHGEAQLGSPQAERDEVWKQCLVTGPEDMDFLNKYRDLLAREAPDKRGKYKTEGFWLGKYTVTQQEWKSVMGTNPSIFQPDSIRPGIKERLAKEKIEDTSRFPVESFRYLDSQTFLQRISSVDGLAKVFGRAGKFVLPDENQWEYACRGGKGNDRAYYWGNELNGAEANCSGAHPFGTSTKAPFLARTCEVDYTNSGKYAVHPWGLCHMCGNVSQWCENQDKKSDMKLVCGGDCIHFARDCRSASHVLVTNRGGGHCGIRVCIALD